MKTVLRIIFLTGLLFAFWGCSSERTIIKDQDITVKVPEVKATMDGEIKNTTPDLRQSIEDFFSTLPESTYIEGISTIIDSSGHVAKASVKMFPNRKKNPETGKPQPIIELNVKQNDLHIKDRDTTYTLKPAGESLWDKVVLVLVLVLGIVLIIKFKK